MTTVLDLEHWGGGGGIGASDLISSAVLILVFPLVSWDCGRGRTPKDSGDFCSRDPIPVKSLSMIL